MGVIKNGAFRSAYYGNQIDALLGAMAQANPLPSGTNWIAFIDDCVAAQEAAEAAQDAAEQAAENAATYTATPPYIGDNGNWFIFSVVQNSYIDSHFPSRGPRGPMGKTAYESAQDGGYTATEAEFNAELAALPTYATDAAGSASAASGSATAAAGSASSASGSATLAESWAVGGTSTRSGEGTDNSKYYCELAQAAAEQASVPPVKGVYNVVVADRSVSGAKYALVVYSGRLKLVGVASTTEATDMTLIDATSGKSYTLVADNGRLLLEEV